MSASGEVRFEVSPTMLDYAWGIVGSQFVLGYLKWLLPVAVIGAGLINLVAHWQFYADKQALFVDSAIYALMWFGVTLMAIALMIFLSARSLKRSKMIGPASYVLNGSAFQIRTPGGQAVTDWASWKEALEFGPVIVTQSRSGYFHVIPRTQLAPETLTALRALLRQMLDGRVHFHSEAVA